MTIAQSRRESVIESCVNTAIGFAVVTALAPVIYPIFGHSFTASQNLGIAAVFTLISVLRGHVVRRWFNGRVHKLAQEIERMLP